MSVEAIIPTKDPNIEHLNRTIDSLERQTYRGADATIMDSTEGGIDFQRANVIHDESLGIGQARKEGILQSNAKYVIHIDEDAVLVYDDHIEKLVEVVENNDVSCAGSKIIPLRGNLDGKIIAGICNISSHSLHAYGLLHKRVLCGDGQCFNVAHRGEDIDIRKHMMHHGEIVKVTDRYIMKDIPTKRQKIARNATLGYAAYRMVK